MTTCKISNHYMDIIMTSSLVMPHSSIIKVHVIGSIINSVSLNFEISHVL